MRIFVTGATGLIGRRVVADRLARGDEVIALSRNARRAVEMLGGPHPRLAIVEGNPAIPGAWQRAVDGCDGVVHLAGASLAGKRWTDVYKQELIDSRVDGTYQVTVGMREAHSPPGVLVCASGIGYYGERGGDDLNEGEPAGEDFLADLAQRWEGQAQQATRYGLRVVMLRFGPVLDRRGGALGKMMPAFGWFAGGPLGLRRVQQAWIHWRDVVGLIDLALCDERAAGPINAVAPNPTTNRGLARAIGRAMKRPWLFPVPGFVLKIVVGQFGGDLTKNIRAVPSNARMLGYVFEHTNVDSAVRSALSERRMPVVRVEPGVEQCPRVRLLAAAVDGVLLRSDGVLSREVIDACRMAQAAGVTILLASARPPRGTAPIGRAIGCTGPSINFDGALIWNPIEQRQQYHEALPAEVATEVISAVREMVPGLFVGVDTLDQWITDRELEGSLGEQMRSAGAPAFVGSMEVCLQQPITRLNLVGEADVLEPVKEMIRERFWMARRIGMFADQPSVVRITAPLVDKGIALQRVARKVGLKSDEVGAIGRASNDLGMIEWAGVGIVTDDAPEHAKVLADHVVDTSNPQWLARLIEDHILRPPPEMRAAT